METISHADQHWAYAIIFDDLGFCGCGNPEENLKIIFETLKLMPLYERDNRFKAQELLGSTCEVILYLLTSANLINHGSYIQGSFLIENGERFLKICQATSSLEELLDAGYSCSDCPKQEDTS